MVALRQLFAISAALALSAPARANEATTKVACAEKYLSAQRLRVAGKLTLARADLLRCAEPACPAFVASDCAVWLSQVDAELPSLVFAVLDPDGRDVPSAVVRVDGVEVPRATDGLAHPVDPGERAIDVVAGEQRVSRRIVARVGEKARRVEVRLERPTPRTPSPETPEHPHVPALAYVLGALTIAGIGAGSTLWATGTSAANAYNDDCATKGCSEAQRANALRQLVAGDIAWGVGLAAGAAAVVVVLSARASGAARLSVGAQGVMFVVTPSW
jgi:hypothetical protein